MIIVELDTGDLDAVHAIEVVSNPNPWPVDAFRRELHLPFSRSFVVRKADDPQVLGYVVLWAIRGEVHILNVAVHPDRRREGIGRRLIEHALDESRRCEGRLIYLEVRRGNAAAKALYETFGFEQVGVRPKYYDDNDEDAIVMMRTLA